MLLNKDGIKPEDNALAVGIRNHLKAHQFVIGNPGLGLKKTLIELEKQRDEKEFDITDWLLKDSGLETRIAMTKAGIEGEEGLCDYLSKLLKYDTSLQGLVAFASLSYEQENNELDYIPDTDTLLVYGRNLLVIDAKNIKTKPDKPLMLEDGYVVDDKGKEIIPVHQSTHIWQRVMANAGIEIDSIDGYVCIVNTTETQIVRNDEWYSSHTKLIHIVELQNILHEWIEGKDNTIYLNILTEIAKAQIKEEKDIDLDIEAIKKKFGL